MLGTEPLLLAEVLVVTDPNVVAVNGTALGAVTGADVAAVNGTALVADAAVVVRAVTAGNGGVDAAWLVRAVVEVVVLLAVVEVDSCTGARPAVAAGSWSPSAATPADGPGRGASRSTPVESTRALPNATS